MSKVVRCGNVLIGGSNPISIQSMTNVDTRDVKGVLKQIERLSYHDCDIARIAVPDMESAEAFREIKRKSPLPLVADIHFDYRLAIEAIKGGADKIRINPGNIGDSQRVKAVVDAAKERGIPIRIGVNAGSLERDILEKNGGRPTAEGIVESALRNVKLLEDMDFSDIVVSVKSSDIWMNHQAHLLLAEATDYPIHIGLTEAGYSQEGRVKSTIALGALLMAGVGHTMRVSLTDEPDREAVLAAEILDALGIRKKGIELISCPTCARTKVSLINILERLKPRLGPIGERRRAAGLAPLSIAVMGCAVNGPGEAAGADFGVACGDGNGVIFMNGKIIKTVKEEEIIEEIARITENYESIQSGTYDQDAGLEPSQELICGESD